jgi:hypothetical protein
MARLKNYPLFYYGRRGQSTCSTDIKYLACQGVRLNKKWIVELSLVILLRKHKTFSFIRENDVEKMTVKQEDQHKRQTANTLPEVSCP